MARRNQVIEITPVQVEAAEREVREKQQEVKFDLRDFTVEHIVQHFQEDLFYVPDYQRFHVWNTEKQARFIESVILGLPIPMMFLAEMPDGTLEIVDGVQRISTLESFYSLDLRLEQLERLPTLNGFIFSDLPVSQQRKLRTRALRIVVLDEATTFETRQDIFNRVNTSGERARASEVRRGAYQGPFMEFLEGLAEDEVFRRVCPISPTLVRRREPLEFVLRFFAYSDSYKYFSHDVAKFLDKYLIENQDNFDPVRMKDEFDATMRFAEKFFQFGFAKKKGATSTPRVRFEALAVGTNLALRLSPKLIPADVKWMQSADFNRLVTTHASNSGPRVKGRIEYVRDQLLEG